jgi:hypothetical protein
LATQSNITVPNSNPTPRIVVKYSSVFYERSLVNTTMTNLVVKGNTITSADGGSVQDQTVYGMGKAYIYISPFDNYYKFTFYKQGAAGDTQLIDLESSGTYFMTFINNSNKKVSAPSIDNKNIANSSKGELAFKVSETLATDILQFTNRNYYITNRPPASTDPSIISDQIPTNTAANNALASRATSLSDSSKDLILAAKQVNQGLNANSLTISSNDSSTLYRGNWLKEGESVPSAGATGASGPTVVASTQDNVSLLPPDPVVDTKSSFQVFGSPETSVTSPTDQSAGTKTETKSALSATELKSAIASVVQGQLVQGWAAEDVISYFLDPTQPGYKLYVGITKKIFTDAVTGIFNDVDITLLNNYGNTKAGDTNGGPAAKKGATVNQTGQDSGSANQF